MKTKVLFLVALFLCGSVMADEKSRQATIAEIFKAQGMQEMLQEHLELAKTTAGELGRGQLKIMLSGLGATEDQLNSEMFKNSELAQIFGRYIERSAAIFSAEELVNAVAVAYGKNLSEADLNNILAFYQSPSGRKDVLASKEAMNEITKIFLIEGGRRTNTLMEQMLLELKAAYPTK